MMSLRAFVVLMCGVLTELIADSSLKMWSLGKVTLGGQRFLYGMGIGMYCLSGIIWASTLKWEPMAKSSVFFFAANGVLCVLMGVWVFKERLSWMSWAGIAAGVLCVTLLALAENPEGALGR